MKTILLVDSDALVLSGWANELAEWNVLQATTAMNARELARLANPDVAFLDLRIDRDSGIELMQELKRDRPALKVAIISGYLTIDATATAARLGADAIVSKPVCAVEILRRLEEVSGRPNLDATPSLARVEYEHIARVLMDCKGNISEAARRLGIHRHSLQRKLRRPAPKA